jgi:hypothetical protein
LNGVNVNEKKQTRFRYAIFSFFFVSTGICSEFTRGSGENRRKKQ